MFHKLVVAILASLAAGCMEFSDITSAIGESRAIAKIGVVAHPELSWPASASRFKRALQFFRSRKVDAIVVLGDLTNDGYLNQYRVLAQAWDDVFRNPAKGIDPAPPRRILVLGDRDRKNFRPEFADAFGGDLSLEGGEFEVNGFRFRATAARPAPGDTPAFFADGKPALTDELCWFPRTRIELNAGSLSGVVPKLGFEPVKGAASASQGLLVVAHAAELTVSRIDFGDDELVASDWIIPLTAKGAAGNIDERAPKFWADTSLRVVPGEVLGKGLSYKVEWPPVLAKHTGVRAHSYEVDVLLPTADGEREAVVKRIYVLSPNFCRAESRDTVPISCRFQADGLPPGAVPRFRVTPISSFGVRGRSISN